MITLCRAASRNGPGSRQEVWLTSYPEGDQPPAPGDGPLETLEEWRLPPGAGVPRPREQSAEVVTYLREGALAYEDSTGLRGVIQAGEFRRTTAGGSLRRRETNASRTHWAHLFEMRLRPPPAGSESGHELRRFSAAQRRGLLCIVASPDGRNDSLRLQQDTLVHSALLQAGQHVVHQLGPGRRAWLHVVVGEVSLDDALLGTGDGAGVVAERAVSLTARVESEILLLDLG
jgi:redox-sensitive bicupin YhaK (pirin superfamily)